MVLSRLPVSILRIFASHAGRLQSGAFLPSRSRLSLPLSRLRQDFCVMFYFFSSLVCLSVWTLSYFTSVMCFLCFSPPVLVSVRVCLSSHLTRALPRLFVVVSLRVSRGFGGPAHPRSR
jgi:hypothetical protein